MKLLSVLLFLIVAVSILLVSILINPDQIKNQYFWITVGWLIVLSALNWIASTFMFIGASQSSPNSRTFGILPSLNILVFIYSFIVADDDSRTSSKKIRIKCMQPLSILKRHKIPYTGIPFSKG